MNPGEASLVRVVANELDVYYHLRLLEIQDERKKQLEGSLQPHRKALADTFFNMEPAQFRKLARQVVRANHPGATDDQLREAEMAVLFGKVGLDANGISYSKDIARLSNDFIILLRIVEAAKDPADLQAIYNASDDQIEALVDAQKDGSQTDMSKTFRGWRVRNQTEFVTKARDKMKGRLALPDGQSQPEWWELSENRFVEVDQATFLDGQARGDKVEKRGGRNGVPETYYILEGNDRIDVAPWCRGGGADYRFKPSADLLDVGNTVPKTIADNDPAFSTIRDVEGHKLLTGNSVTSYGSGLNVTEYKNTPTRSGLQALSDEVDKQSAEQFNGGLPTVSIAHIADYTSGTEKTENRYVMVISSAGIGEVGAEHLVSPSTTKIFISDATFRKVEARSQKVQQDVLQHLRRVEAAGEILDILGMNYGDLIREEGGLPKSPEAKALLEEMNRVRDLLADVEFKDGDSPERRNQKMIALDNNLAERGQMFNIPVDAVSPSSRARIGVIEGEMITGSKTTAAINQAAAKIAPSQVQYDLAVRAQEALKHNTFKLSLTPDDIAAFKKKFREEGGKLGKGDADDLELILDASFTCPVDPSDGPVVLIDKPRAGAKGFQTLSDKRMYSDGRPNKANVAFIGDPSQPGDYMANVHIPSTRELYRRCERAKIGGMVDIYDKDGNKKRVKVEAGQLIMHGCAFRKSAEGYKPVALDKLKPEEREAFTNFSVAATSVNEKGEIMDVAVAFNGASCNAGLETHHKRMVSKVLQHVPLLRRLEPAITRNVYRTSEEMRVDEKANSPYGKEGVFQKLSCEFEQDPKGLVRQPGTITAAEQKFVKDKGCDPQDLRAVKYADIGTHDPILCVQPFRIVQPIYGLKGALLPMHFLKGDEPQIEVFENGAFKRMPLTEQNLATVYRGGDCKEYCQEMLDKAKDKKSVVTVIISETETDAEGEKKKHHVRLKSVDQHSDLFSVGGIEAGAAYKQRKDPSNSCAALYAKKMGIPYQIGQQPVTL
jgi:hypothetical protein